MRINKKRPISDSSELEAPALPQSSPDPSGRFKASKTHIIPEYHDIGTAVAMSLFLPGAGQVYNGQIAKGITLILLTFAGIFAVTAMPNPVTLFLGGKGEFIVWFAGICDTAIIARRLRRGQVVSAWKWF